MTDEDFTAYLREDPGDGPHRPLQLSAEQARTLAERLWFHRERHTLTGLDRRFLRHLFLRWED